MEGDKKMFAIVGAMIALFLVVAIANSNTSSRIAPASEGVEATSPASPEAAYHLSPDERNRWQEEPDSKGFNDSDRQFLEDHGVTEAEARAAEAILREHGLD